MTLQFGPSTVQYSQVIKFRLFFIFTHAPCGNVSQQMDIFSSSSNSFQPLTFCSYLAEKNTSFIPTRDPWPTRHDLTSSPSYVITSVCDSFSDRISNLICIVVNNHCVSFHHDLLGVLSHAFSSETQRHLYCLCKLPSRPARCAFSCFLKWDAAPPILSV